eukprot:Platyproteum_vivax@DN15905_c0_g1_i1.p1
MPERTGVADTWAELDAARSGHYSAVCKAVKLINPVQGLKKFAVSLTAATRYLQSQGELTMNITTLRLLAQNGTASETGWSVLFVDNFGNEKTKERSPNYSAEISRSSKAVFKTREVPLNFNNNEGQKEEESEILTDPGEQSNEDVKMANDDEEQVVNGYFNPKKSKHDEDYEDDELGDELLNSENSQRRSNRLVKTVNHF